MDKIVQVLAAAASPDEAKRKAAEAHLKQFEQSNLAGYVTAMCQVMAHEKIPPDIRQLAGLNLKNTMTSKDEQQKQVLAKRWLNVPEGVRENIRKMALQILGANDKQARRGAALVVARIGSVEIPRGGWKNLVDILLQQIRQKEKEGLRQAAFDALGYLMDEVAECLGHKSNEILTAIASGMQQDEKNNEIKFAATKALANSLPYVTANMRSDKERKLIMSMIFAAVQSKDAAVRTAAYECLVNIAGNYYEYLLEFIMPIFKLTTAAMKNEVEEVQLQAIEFWSTVCDEEIDIMDDIEEAQARKQAPKRKLHNLVAKALQGGLTPLLLAFLTKQADDPEDKSWSPAQAAGTCLGLVAKTTRDQCMNYILPFVKANIKNGDWHFREAATLAFGCMLDGPSTKTLKPVVLQALPVILQQMVNDPHVHVKDTAAWTVGQTLNTLPELVLEQRILPQIIQTIIKALQDAPSIAAHACWAIHNIAEAIDHESGGEAKTSPLSRYFEIIMKALFAVTVRRDVENANLLSASYEAISILIQTAPEDMFPLISKMLPTLLHRLKETIGSGAQLTGNKRVEVQGLLCASLQVIIQRLTDDAIVAHADALMTLFLKVFENKTTSVLEEALMAVGAVATRTKANFAKYMGHFNPILLKGLASTQEHHLCIVSVGVAIDVARALEKRIAPFLDGIMKQLLTNLGNKEIDRSVKPHVISSFADIAMAIGGAFDRYLQTVMQMLISASKTTVPEQTDPDNVEFLNALRTSIFEAYTGILTALSADKKQNLFLQYTPAVIGFIDMVGSDRRRDEDLLKASVGTIGDMASELGAQPQLKQMLQRPAIQTLVHDALRSETEGVNKQGQWAKEALEAMGRA